MVESHLERDVALLEEASQAIILQRGQVKEQAIGQLEITTVTSLGSYQSEILGKPLYLALKESRLDGILLTRGMCRFDLAIMRKIAEEFPHLADELPIIHGVLLDKSGKPLGAITEDFSQGGRYPVLDIASNLGRIDFPGHVPYELAGLVKRDTTNIIDVFELTKMGFVVNGRRRLGDFNSIITHLGLAEIERLFPNKDIMDNPRPYTMRISYDL